MDDFKTLEQYSGEACFYCNAQRTEDSNTCDKCCRVTYCGFECQRADWGPSHRSHCIAWSDAIRAFPLSQHPILTSFPSTTDDLKTIMDALNTQLMVPVMNKVLINGRRIATVLVFRAPRCQKCLALVSIFDEAAGVISLPGCGSCDVRWCEKEACAVVAQEHKDSGLCSTVAAIAREENLLHESYRRSNSITVHLPLRILRVETPLPLDWVSYLKSITLPKYIDLERHHLFAQHSLSIPLTIVAALVKFGLFSKFSNAKDPRTLTIHLIGAEKEFEVDYGAPVLEEITHLLPGVRELVVIMIGRSLPKGSPPTLPVNRCAECQRRRRTRRVDIHPITYQTFLDLNPTSPPSDLAVAFNSGVCEDPVFWAPAILSLVLSGAPAVFTSFNQVEAAADEQTVRRLGRNAVEMVWSGEKSSFPSGRKHFDLFSPEFFWSENMYWFGWRGNLRSLV